MEQSWKVTLTLDTLDATLIDLLSHVLFEQGATGIEVDYAQGYLENHPNLFGELAEAIPKERLEHPTEIIAYYDEEQSLAEIQSRIATLTALDYQLEQVVVPHENWQENWMQHYRPQRLSRYMTIVPVWEDYQADKNENCIYLDPGLAFGTGNHPTTQLGVQALEMYVRGGECVLDVGTGSGVLAFAAVAYGATQVYGYDLDPQAVDSAKQNLTYQVERREMLGEQFEQATVAFAVNDLLNGVTHKANIIVANILPHILVNMFDDARQLLTDDGYLILGGILDEKASEIEAALHEHQWTIVQRTHLRGWVGYVAQKAGA